MVGSSVLLGAVFIAVGYLVSALVRDRGTAGGIAVGIWLVFVLIYDMAFLGLLVVDQGQTVSGGVLNALLLLNPTDVYRLFNLTGFANVSSFSGMAGRREQHDAEPRDAPRGARGLGPRPAGARGARVFQERAMRRRSLSGHAGRGAGARRLQRQEDGGSPAAARAHGERHRQLLRHERAGAPGSQGRRSSWRAGSSRSGSRPRATRCPSPCCPRSRRTSARSTSPTWRRRRAGRSPARTIGSTRSRPCSSWEAGSRAAWARTRPSPSPTGRPRTDSRPRTAGESWPSRRCRGIMFSAPGPKRRARSRKRRRL